MPTHRPAPSSAAWVLGCTVAAAVPPLVCLLYVLSPPSTSWVAVGDPGGFGGAWAAAAERPDRTDYAEAGDASSSSSLSAGGDVAAAAALARVKGGGEDGGGAKGSPLVCCGDAPRLSALSWPVKNRRVAVSKQFSTDGRQGLAHILRTQGARTGVEVGVKDAFFSDILLGRTGANFTLFMVDPWMSQKNYADLVETAFGTGDETYRKAKARVAEYGPRAVVVRQTSADAAPRFANHSLDFVYLDARHDYAAVLEDLAVWWPKLAPGGLMSGHDFYYANDTCVRRSGQDWTLQADGTHSWKGVRGAVEDFFAARPTTMPLSQANWKMGRVLTSLHKTLRRPLRPGMVLPEIRRGDCRFPSWMVVKRRTDWS